MEASSVPGEERHTFTRPVYLLERPLAVRLVLVVVVPLVFGAICGFFLGHSKTAYIALQVLAAIGGGGARFRHRRRRGGAVPGPGGGALFWGGGPLLHPPRRGPRKGKVA